MNAEELVANAISGNNRRVMYVAPTLGVARTLMWERLKQYGATVQANDTRLEMKVATPYKGTSTIFLGSWEKVEMYRGDEFDFLVFDEVQDYKNFWVGWQEAMRPTLTPRKGMAMFTGTPKGFNHFYDLYNKEYEDQDYKSFKFTTYDNPFIDPQEIESERKSKTEDEFAQEYLAEFRKSSGLVFKEFDRTKHVYNYDLTGFSEYVAGIDFGYTNPTAIPHVLVKDGVFYVCHELYRTHMTDDEVGDYVASERFNKVYPDPEAPATIEVMRRKGINIRDVKKGKDSIAAGIQKMRELFKQNKLFIHKDCINLISELEMYSYPDGNQMRNESENPQDKYNHAIDALRYVVSTHVMGRPFISRPMYDKTKEIWNNR